MLNVAAKMMPSSSNMFEMTIHDFPISPQTPINPPLHDSGPPPLFPIPRTLLVRSTAGQEPQALALRSSSQDLDLGLLWLHDACFFAFSLFTTADLGSRFKWSRYSLENRFQEFSNCREVTHSFLYEVTRRPSITLLCPTFQITL